MPEKIFFYLLLLCEIWSQGITGTFVDEDTTLAGESSNFLLRQKRVVNRIPGQDVSMSITGVPYVVIIKLNHRITCVGSILSRRVVISISICVTYAARPYQVVSGTTRSDRGTAHNVTDIQKHVGGHPSRSENSIALITVDPPFVYGTLTKPIELHSEPLLPGTLGLVSGWGYNFGNNDRGTNIPTVLRSIAVPIISHRECVIRYQPHLQITDKEVCTYHPQKYCGHNDGGAPLVVNGQLAGVHIWTGLYGCQYDQQYPDVFAMLQHSEYNQWIRSNVRNIEAQFQDDRN